MAYGGGEREPGLLPVPVPLTQFGYSRIIPAFHRKMIYRHDDKADIFFFDTKADILVHIYLPFFSLAKVILVAKRISNSTFKSIVIVVQDRM